MTRACLQVAALRRCSSSLCLLALLWSPLGASADRSGTTSSLLREGIRLHSRGEFEASLKLLRRAALAVDRQQRARARLYSGLNLALLGRMSAARAALTHALAADPDLQLDPRHFKAPLVRLFREVRAGLGELVVSADVDGAVVQIDRRLAGRTPYRTLLPPGKHWIEVLSGDRSYAAQVTLLASRSVRIDAVLRQRHRARRQANSSFWRRRRLWTWVAAGTAAATATAAIAVWSAAKAQHQQWQDHAAAWQAAVETNQQEEQEAERARLMELRDSIQTKVDVTNLLVAVTLGLTATSAVLLLLEGRPPRRKAARTPRTVQLAPAVGAAGGSLWLSVSF